MICARHGLSVTIASRGCTGTEAAPSGRGGRTPQAPGAGAMSEPWTTPKGYRPPTLNELFRYVRSRAPCLLTPPSAESTLRAQLCFSGSQRERQRERVPAPCRPTRSCRMRSQAQLLCSSSAWWASCSRVRVRPSSRPRAGRGSAVVLAVPTRSACARIPAASIGMHTFDSRDRRRTRFVPASHRSSVADSCQMTECSSGAIMCLSSRPGAGRRRKTAAVRGHETGRRQ